MVKYRWSIAIVDGVNLIQALALKNPCWYWISGTGLGAANNAMVHGELMEWCDLTTGGRIATGLGQGSKLEPESQKRDPESRLNGWAEMGASLSVAELRWNCHRFWTAT